VELSDATKTALTSLPWFGPTPSLRLSSPTISPLGDESSSSSRRIKCEVRSVGVTTWTGLAEMNSGGGGGGRAINQNAATDLCLCVCIGAINADPATPPQQSRYWDVS